MNAISNSIIPNKLSNSTKNEPAITIRENTVSSLSSSTWSNILYGIGMVAYLSLPPMIPGVTAHDLIVFNVGLVIFIYFAAFIAQSVKVIRFNKKRR